jgi:REP element-mobilizing transposase RayT
MTNYRRYFVPGGSYFFTVNLAERRLRLLTEHINALRASFRYARVRHPFAIDAIVVLPDHLHAIWTLPDGDKDFPLRWRLIKASFSRILPQGSEYRAAARARLSAEFGSGGIGSTCCATKTTLRVTPITSTSIQSSTATYREYWIGRIRHFTAWCSSTLPPGLGWRLHGIPGARFRRAMMGFVALNPSYLLPIFKGAERCGAPPRASSQPSDAFGRFCFKNPEPVNPVESRHLVAFG